TSSGQSNWDCRDKRDWRDSELHKHLSHAGRSTRSYRVLRGCNLSTGCSYSATMCVVVALCENSMTAASDIPPLCHGAIVPRFHEVQRADALSCEAPGFTRRSAARYYSGRLVHRVASALRACNCGASGPLSPEAPSWTSLHPFALGQRGASCC